MDLRQLYRWRPTRRELLWAGVIVALAFLFIVICGYLFGWKWTGLPKRTLWDWLKLLIVPSALALGVFWLNRAQERERQSQEDRTQRERDVEAAQREQEREATEEARRKRDLEVAEQRAQDEALQAYLDKMTDLLVVHKLGKRRLLKPKVQGNPVRTVAWARTKTVLRRLHDGAHKGRVLRFLGEAGLLNKPAPVIDLKGADLREADLRGSYLVDVCLKEADLRGVNLRGAVLREPDLSGGNLLPYDKQNPDQWSRYSLKNIDSGKEDFRASGLTIADLSGASLVGALLCNAYVGGADLRNAELTNGELRGALLSQADLSDANLIGADLSHANLSEAVLRDANLLNTVLIGALGLTDEPLEQAESLEGATMPNGQKYEDWLKDRQKRQQDE